MADGVSRLAFIAPIAAVTISIAVGGGVAYFTTVASLQRSDDKLQTRQDINISHVEALERRHIEIERMLVEVKTIQSGVLQRLAAIDAVMAQIDPRGPRAVTVLQENVRELNEHIKWLREIVDTLEKQMFLLTNGKKNKNP